MIKIQCEFVQNAMDFKWMCVDLKLYQVCIMFVSIHNWEIMHSIMQTASWVCTLSKRFLFSVSWFSLMALGSGVVILFSFKFAVLSHLEWMMIPYHHSFVTHYQVYNVINIDQKRERERKCTKNNHKHNNNLITTNIDP